MHSPSVDWPEAVTVLNEHGRSPIVLTCEHASRHIPAEYADLGLPPRELERHIAWDIGAGALTRSLSAALDAPAFLGTYSRLLIDLNRPLDSPTSIPERSEATDIPGNRDLAPAERRRRADRIFHPFQQRLSAFLDARARSRRPTAIVAVHSFTPVFHGHARPWHAGILFSHSKELAEALLSALAEEKDLVLAANEPYTIERASDYTVPVHGEDRGIPAVLLEIRQDLLADRAGVAEWSKRLTTALRAVLGDSPTSRATPGHVAP
ncbi:N-formylglutamate amidohydrolase [Pseudomonas sp. R2.Fl]|nr:N-formylglutamate amidohydrolase [Pseudomonas sp. R2.Fl]